MNQYDAIELAHLNRDLAALKKRFRTLFKSEPVTQCERLIDLAGNALEGTLPEAVAEAIKPAPEPVVEVEVAPSPSPALIEDPTPSPEPSPVPVIPPSPSVFASAETAPIPPPAPPAPPPVE